MSEELKYEFNMSDPDSWSKMPKPYLSESFVKETNRIGGNNRHGKPRFKFVWGMSEEVYVKAEASDQFQSGWYTKYSLCERKVLMGFRWTENGESKFSRQVNNIPAGAITTNIYHMEQIGTPRWVLEEWRDEGDCGGLYERSGYFFHRWIVGDGPENPDTLLKPYREPDQRDLDLLANYVQLTAKLTDKDVKQGVAQDREKEAERLEKSRQGLREEIAEDFVEMFTDMKGVKLPEPTKADVANAVKRLNK